MTSERFDEELDKHPHFSDMSNEQLKQLKRALAVVEDGDSAKYQALKKILAE